MSVIYGYCFWGKGLAWLVFVPWVGLAPSLDHLFCFVVYHLFLLTVRSYRCTLGITDAGGCWGWPWPFFHHPPPPHTLFPVFCSYSVPWQANHSKAIHDPHLLLPFTRLVHTCWWSWGLPYCYVADSDIAFLGLIRFAGLNILLYYSIPPALISSFTLAHPWPAFLVLSPQCFSLLFPVLTWLPFTLSSLLFSTPLFWSLSFSSLHTLFIQIHDNNHVQPYAWLAEFPHLYVHLCLDNCCIEHNCGWSSWCWSALPSFLHLSLP